ncbi:MAG TPA: hypothetical protein PK449_05760, partial [Exilispira sp.]|nr:hypothetical protein [Exilispira sp.]
IEGKKLHTAIRYGLSQALLEAVALAKNKLKVEIIWDEYNLEHIIKPVPILVNQEMTDILMLIK